MSEQETFKTIAQPVFAEFKDRGSRFLAYAYPVVAVEECKEKISVLKKENPKAVHHCFAYRIGLDKNTFRASDDGEPSGTAGKPILGQIDSKGLTNVLIVVVRYFGGTLLGVPGLINAYRSAASMALQLTPILQKPITTRSTINFSYIQMNEIMRYLKTFNCEIIEQQMNLFCSITIDIPKAKLNEFVLLLKEMRDVEIVIPEKYLE